MLDFILNKSENATPGLFAIYIQNDAIQYSYRKCIYTFKDWVMHNSKRLTDVFTRNDIKAFKCDRGLIIQATKINKKLTQFRSSEIH